MYEEGETYLEHGDISGKHRTHHHTRHILRGAYHSRPLLEMVFSEGERIKATPSIEEIRASAIQQISGLPEEYKRLRNPEIYRVMISEHIGEMKEQFIARLD